MRWGLHEREVVRPTTGAGLAMAERQDLSEVTAAALTRARLRPRGVAAVLRPTAPAVQQRRTLSLAQSLQSRGTGIVPPTRAVGQRAAVRALHASALQISARSAGCGGARPRSAALMIGAEGAHATAQDSSTVAPHSRVRRVARVVEVLGGRDGGCAGTDTERSRALRSSHWSEHEHGVERCERAVQRERGQQSRESLASAEIKHACSQPVCLRRLQGCCFPLLIPFCPLLYLPMSLGSVQVIVLLRSPAPPLGLPTSPKRSVQSIRTGVAPANIENLKKRGCDKCFSALAERHLFL